MKRKVTYAKFHDLTFVLAGFSVSKELPMSSRSLPSLTMWYTPEGLFVQAVGKEYVIPLANVQYVVLAPEEAPTKAKS